MLPGLRGAMRVWQHFSMSPLPMFSKFLNCRPKQVRRLAATPSGHTTSMIVGTQISDTVGWLGRPGPCDSCTYGYVRMDRSRCMSIQCQDIQKPLAQRCTGRSQGAGNW